MTELLDAFAPAKGLWMVRSFADCVNSNLRQWRGGRNMIDALVEDRGKTGFRGRGMTNETYTVVKRHYRPDMDDASAQALFWYYRNQLYFDQKLDADPRVLAISYEDLVRMPDVFLEHIASFLGLDVTSQMKKIAHAASIGKHAQPDIDPDIVVLCETMQQRLNAATGNVSSATRRPKLTAVK